MTLHPFETRLGNLLALSYPALAMAYKDKVALAAVLVWALVAISRHRVAFGSIWTEFRFIGIAFCGFFLWASVSLLLSGSGPRDLGLTLRLPLLLLTLPLLASLRLDRRFVWWGIWLGVVVAVGLAAWDRYANGAGRPGESFHFIIHFSDFTVLFSMMLLLGWHFWREIRLGRLAAVIVIASAALASIWSGTRGAWLAVPVLLVFVAFSGALPIPGRSIRIATAGLLLLGALLAGWKGIPFQPEQDVSNSRVELVTSEIRDYFTNGNANTSVGARLELWRASWIHFSEHPVFGVGAYGLEQANRSLMARGEQIAPAVLQFGHAHSQWVEALATGGLVGLAALGALFAFPWIQFQGLKRRATTVDGRIYATAGQFTLVAFATFCLSQSMFNHQGPVGTFGFLIVFFAALANGDTVSATVDRPSKAKASESGIEPSDGSER